MTRILPLSSVVNKIVLGVLEQVPEVDRPRYIARLTEEQIASLGYPSRDAMLADFCPDAVCSDVFHIEREAAA